MEGMEIEGRQASQILLYALLILALLTITFDFRWTISLMFILGLLHLIRGLVRSGTITKKLVTGKQGMGCLEFLLCVFPAFALIYSMVAYEVWNVSGVCWELLGAFSIIIFCILAFLYVVTVSKEE